MAWIMSHYSFSYFVLDHQLLGYLNIIEKFHCVYCSYAVGLLAYATEVTARTEQYFCPIKHAGKILNAHSRYQHFIEYGDADDFHGRLEAFRAELARGEDQAGQQQRGGSHSDSGANGSNPTSM